MTHLSFELLALLGRVILGVAGYVTTTNVLDWNVLDVEADIVAGIGLLECCVMHLDGLHLGRQIDWSEGDDHTGLENTSLHSADWDCSNTCSSPANNRC